MEGNEYRLTPFKVARKSFCNYYEESYKHAPEFYDAFKFPPVCPLKKGLYSGNYSWTFDNIPPNFEGKYKLVTRYYNQGEFAEETVIYAEIHHYFMG
jgi:hypothetical protein